METMIRKRRNGGGVAIIITVTMACILFIVMLSVTTTTTIVVVQANNNKKNQNNNAINRITDTIVTSLLRGQGRRLLVPTISSNRGGEEEVEEEDFSYYYYSKPIATRKLEDAAEEAEAEAEEDEAEEEAEAEEEEEQQQDDDENEADNEAEQNQNGNEDDENNNNHMDTDFFEQMVSDLKDRFDSDVALMWQTSPSEWDDTTWKDFTIMGGIVAGLVASILCCCCFCCRGGGSGRGRDVKTLLENKRARGKHRQKQERRSNRYFNRSRSEETGDSHSDYTGSYSGHNNNSTDDWEAPFVLIEDVESKDDTFSKTAGGSKSTTAAHIASTPTSPVYAKRNESLEDGGSTSYAALSPLSSGSKTEPGTSDDIESLGNRTSSSLPIVSNVATQKNGTTTSRTLTKKSSPALQESSGGIVGETVDVWSEFLGLKKTKYNIQADHLDEDSQVDETDDEKGGDRRRKRNKSSMKSTKIKSPKSDLTNTSQNMLSSLHTRSIHVGSVSTVSESAPTTGSAGAGATAIVSDTAVDNNDPGGSVADSATAAGTIVSSATNGTTGTNTNNNTNKGSSASSVAETPITSNAKSSKGTRSPRKGFLKSKKNLRIFGGNKSKNNNNNSNNNNNNKEPLLDSKEESLLSEVDRNNANGEDPIGF